ncbi:MAG: hypothetical protein A2020_01140 [Lentisphaerae bacterium GWF2_45_14]|nr:MAG: hypothetical protein A2020_01140 [Lentisphaerae bacterium GWF2_45_14]
MKITDDIFKAVQRTVEAFGSIGEFAEKANIQGEILTDFLTKKTKSIKDDTWEKIYPFVKNYLPGGSPTEVKGMHLKGHLTTDQRILMDAFDELSKETREKKLIEIVELARVEVERKNSKFF